MLRCPDMAAGYETPSLVRERLVIGVGTVMRRAEGGVKHIVATVSKSAKADVVGHDDAGQFPARSGH